MIQTFLFAALAASRALTSALQLRVRAGRPPFDDHEVDFAAVRIAALTDKGEPTSLRLFSSQG